MPERTDVVAAGAVVLRPGREVLLVHRPRYDDWSLPKGKLDPGEVPPVAAVREVGEETGLRVRLGPPLPPQRYVVAAGDKTVHWWVGRPVGDDDVSGFAVNDEVDAVVWLPWREAVERLTYPRDRATLAAAQRLRRRSAALVVLRHGKAFPRKEWTQPSDRGRPLAAAGEEQAQRLVPLLAAYGATRVVTSSSTRCTQTVAPYAARAGLDVEEVDGLSEEDATDTVVQGVVDGLLAARQGAVLCTHRRVLPLVLDALRLPHQRLQPGGAVVVHHRNGEVVAVELQQHA